MSSLVSWGSASRLKSVPSHFHVMHAFSMSILRSLWSSSKTLSTSKQLKTSPRSWSCRSPDWSGRRELQRGWPRSARRPPSARTTSGRGPAEKKQSAMKWHWFYHSTWNPWPPIVIAINSVMDQVFTNLVTSRRGFGKTVLKSHNILRYSLTVLLTHSVVISVCCTQGS